MAGSTSATKALLGIGTATWSTAYGLGQKDLPASSLVQKALDSGITYLDTAPAYGDAEEVIGQLESSREQIRICTKIDGRSESSAVFDGSLKRLRCDHVDTLLLHSASREAFESPDAMIFLKNARTARLARRIGASTYGSYDAGFALRSEWCDTVQVEYSILNPSVLAAIVPLKRNGQEIVVRSVLCKGLLTSRRQTAQLPDAVNQSLDELERLAETWGFTLTQLGIRFALDSVGVDVVLVGVVDDEELDVAVKAHSAPSLDQQQFAVLSKFNLSQFDCAHPERWA